MPSLIRGIEPGRWPGDHWTMRKSRLACWYSHAALTMIAAVVLMLLNGTAR